MDTALLDHLESLEIQVTQGLLGIGALKGLKVDMATVVALIYLIYRGPLVVKVTGGPQALQESQGPKDQEGRRVFREYPGDLDKRDWLDYQVL